MRKLPLIVLLASVAAPSFAADDPSRAERRAERRAAAAQADSAPDQSAREERRQQRAERREQRAERQAARVQADGDSSPRIERIERIERTREERAERRAARVQSEDDSTARIERVERIRERRADQVSGSPNADEGGARIDRVERIRHRRVEQGSSGQDATGGLQPRQRRVRTVPDTQPSAVTDNAPLRERVERRPRRDYRDGDYRRWSNRWRHDDRYDWRRWRNRHRSLFRIGLYYDPFGWNYRRWNIGWHMWPSHYHSRYWLSDPWRYRLPPAYGPYRWVRYWDDALLVNVYTGEVVDVIHNFFW